MNNLDIYNKAKSVPEEATTKITAGRLKNKTNINPQWRIFKLTEMFGPCGFGWKYKITRQWIEEGGNGEKSAFTNIDLFVKMDGEWSEAIPGNGGSSFVAMESKGLYTSDEAFKMALTDAISVSCKALGIGADVYWSEGNKYTEQERRALEGQNKNKDTSGSGKTDNKTTGKTDNKTSGKTDNKDKTDKTGIDEINNKKVSEKQLKRFYAIAKEKGINDTKPLDGKIKEAFNISSKDDWLMKDYKKFTEFMDNNPADKIFEALDKKIKANKEKKAS